MQRLPCLLPYQATILQIRIDWCDTANTPQKFSSGAKSSGNGKTFRIFDGHGFQQSLRKELLARMLSRVDELCVERDRMVGEQRVKYPGTGQWRRFR